MIGQRRPWRNAPYKWFKLPWGHDSLWAHLCVYPQVLLLFLLLRNASFVSLLSFSLWRFVSTQLMGQGLVTDCWSSDWDSVLSLLHFDLNFWLETEILLQTPADQGYLRSIWEWRQLGVIAPVHVKKSVWALTS